LALLLMLPGLARAHELPASLSVEHAAGAEQCAGREQLERRVEGILRRPWPASGEGEPLAITVQFGRARDGSFQAKVGATGPKPGERLLRDSSPGCDALSEAVAVAIALLLDSAQNEASEPAPAKPLASTPAAEPHEPAAPPAPAKEGLDWSLRVGLEAGGGYGLGGGATALGAGHVGAKLSRWRVDLGVLATLPESRAFDGGDVSTSLLFGHLRACYFLGRSFQVGPCAHLGVGRLLGEGSDYGEAQRTSLPWLAAGLGLGAEVALNRRAYVSLGTTLWVPSERHTFSVENAGIAWESRRAATVATAGIGVSLF
jgi:hypothetical protein